MPPIIRKLDEFVTIFSLPFSRFGVIPVGGRSTAVKTSTGNVVLFASTPSDPTTQETLRSLGGTVSHIVALDAVHQLFLSDYVKLYPEAKLVGPKGLVSKRSDLKFDIILPDHQLDAELDRDFKAQPLTGHPNEDIIWYHKPSKTVIQADAMFNLPGKDQASFSLIPKFALRQLTPWTAFHRMAVSAFSKMDPKGFSEAATIVNGWKIDRIVPCHGDVIEGADKAQDAWRSLFRNFIKDDKSS